MINETLKNYNKEQLIELIEGYCKNWLAMDGVWFQSVERKYGMDEAMEHDCAIWEKFTVIEAKRIKTFLNLPETCSTLFSKNSGWQKAIIKNARTTVLSC